MSRKKAAPATGSIAGYVLRAYAFTWLMWAPLLPPLKSSIGPLASPYLHLLGSLGPALAAIAVTLQAGGSTALAELSSRVFRWRVPIVWHFVAWFAPFGLYIVALLIATFGVGDFGGVASFTGQVEYPDLGPPLLWLAILVFYGFGEEIGWRGFLQPALERHMAPLPAALVVSVIWAGWHLPLFWISPALASLDALGAVGWYVSIVAGSVLMAWLTNNARGSILIAAAFHATLDIAFVTAGPASTAPLLGAMVTLWGAVIAVIWLRAGRWGAMPARR